MSFLNKVVIVTGAGSGIGAATAKNFAKSNARLCLIDLNLDNLTKVCKECENISKCKVLKLVADLSHDENVRRSVDNTLKEFGRIDVLVNCVGIHGPGSLLDADILEKYDRTMTVNLRSVIAMTSQATPALIESKGNVINISSISSQIPSQSIIPYNLSKAGLTQFTKCAALELAQKGVRVNCISPGAVQTNILLSAGFTESEANVLWAKIGDATPLRRAVKVEEIAGLIEYLASDKAIGITGSDFVADAGQLLLGAVGVPNINLNTKK